MDIGVAKEFGLYRGLKNGEIQVLFEIQSKNGRDISGISEFNGIFDPKNQKEVLFTNNTAFEIIDRYTDSNGVLRIKLIER